MVISKRAQVIRELQRIKAALGLSQVELAERIRVTQPAVSAWLSGDALPNNESLAKISDAFPELTSLIVSAALEPILGVPGGDANDMTPTPEPSNA